MAKSNSLGRAKDAKQDEFYTQLADIENELRHYRPHFKGKTVLCNCDDPYESNFFKYFALNFNKLKLKKLIATCYSGSPITGTQLSLFGDETEDGRRTPYKAVVTTVHDTTGEGGIDMLDVAELFRTGENTIEQLHSDGDFRSPECLELLDESDIVVTNPPFSLFREYLTTLIDHNKQILIIGSENAITYKEVFRLLQEDKVWLGYNNGDMAFQVPDDYEPRATRYWQDETGQKWRSMGNICWYTNLDIKKRHEEMILVKRCKPDYIDVDTKGSVNFNHGPADPRVIHWPDGRSWTVESIYDRREYGRAIFGNLCVEVGVCIAKQRKTIWWEGGRWFVAKGSGMAATAI